MPILITGANGQVGYELAQQAPAGQARALDRQALDITDPQAVAQCLDQTKPTWVVNAAAYTAVDKAEQEPEAAYAANRDGPRHLAEACRQRDIPLIHFSTDYVFDGQKASPYSENDPTSPLGVYGESKRAGELAIQDTHDKHIILRTSWVFGRQGNNFVKTMVRLARAGQELKVVNDQFGSPTPASLIAQVAWRIIDQAERRPLPWGLYHLGGRPHTSWYEFAKLIIAEAATLGVLSPVKVSPINSEEYPTPVTRPLNSRLTCQKLLQWWPEARLEWLPHLKQVLTELPPADPPTSQKPAVKR